MLAGLGVLADPPSWAVVAVAAWAVVLVAIVVVVVISTEQEGPTVRNLLAKLTPYQREVAENVVVLALGAALAAYATGDRGWSALSAAAVGAVAGYVKSLVAKRVGDPTTASVVDRRSTPEA